MPTGFWAFWRWNWGVYSEFWRGYRLLRGIGPCVTVFGSSRFVAEHAHYQLATRVGAALARAGFTVLSGGGPSTMRAASEGARAAGGRAIGVAIRLPHEKRANDFLDRVLVADHFHVRKTLLMVRADGFVVLPGGVGTLDELLEVATLMVTGKAPARPIVLLNRAYWGGFLEWLNLEVRASGAISAAELEIFQCVDTADEAVEIVVNAAKSRRPRDAMA